MEERDYLIKFALHTNSIRFSFNSILIVTCNEPSFARVRASQQSSAQHSKHQDSSRSFYL